MRMRWKKHDEYGLYRIAVIKIRFSSKKGSLERGQGGEVEP